MKINCNDCKYNINGWCNKQDKILDNKNICLDFEYSKGFIRKVYSGSYEDFVESLTDLIAIRFYKDAISKINTNHVEYGKVLKSINNEERGKNHERINKAVFEQ